MADNDTVASEEPAIQLDSRQSRRLFLAGTTPFPAPFPSTGTISIESGTLRLHDDEPRLPTTFVVLQERSRHDRFTLRVIRAEDAAAVFIPGDWKYQADQSRTFRRRRRRAIDLERGEWFLQADITAEKIMERIGEDVSRRSSRVKGIVFVPDHLPVFTITEAAQDASAAGLAGAGHFQFHGGGSGVCCCCCGCDDC